MNDNLKGNFDYTARVLDRTEFCDLSDDYTLPDYMPAIGRVISCTATAALPALYLGGGNIELAGSMRYRLCYESIDDSSLWCAELPSEYDHLIPTDRIPNIPSDLGDVSGLVYANPENIAARITAPRRLTVKSRIRLCMKLSGNKKFETAFRGDTSDTDSIRILEKSSPYGINICGSSSPIICRDKVSLSELGLSDKKSYRIISSRGSVMITRLEAENSTIDCRGEINTCMILTAEDDNECPRRITRRIPFSAEIPLNNNPKNTTPEGIRAYGVCPLVSASVDEDGISLEATALVCAESVISSELTYIKDIYSQKAECEVSMATPELSIPIACFNGNATISAQYPLDSLGINNNSKLFDFYASVLPATEWSVIDGRKLVINGKIKIAVIVDNGTELTPTEFESDFKYIAEIPDIKEFDSLKTNIIADIYDIKCRIDGDKVTADCELCVAVLIENEKKIQAVSEVNLSSLPDVQKSEPRIIVCYPTKGETLWDVAKRYHVDAYDIAENNSLNITVLDDAESLAKSKFLII